VGSIDINSPVRPECIPETGYLVFQYDQINKAMDFAYDLYSTGSPLIEKRRLLEMLEIMVGCLKGIRTPKVPYEFDFHLRRIFHASVNFRDIKIRSFSRTKNVLMNPFPSCRGCRYSYF
jgi:hypothetical protein